MPRGHEHDPIYSQQYLRALFGPIFLYVFLEKDCNGKNRSLCRVWMQLWSPFSPRNIHWSSLFARKAPEKTEQVPPWHPIILHKFDKFNMADVSVKWSIVGHCVSYDCAFIRDGVFHAVSVETRDYKRNACQGWIIYGPLHPSPEGGNQIRITTRLPRFAWVKVRGEQ